MANETLMNEILDILEYFDIERYLDSRNIEYWAEGKNIKHGWIGIQCLWCDDSSNHLGINLDTKSINCFRCPIKGTVIRIIMKIERCSLRSVLKIVKEFSDLHLSREITTDYTQHTERKSIVELPALATTELLPQYKKFLENRGFDPEYIFKKYKLQCAGPIGDFKQRLIIPFYLKNRLVTFTARDITGKASIPYKHLPAEKSVLSAKETIYNIQNCKDIILVVEGATDVWKVGDNCGATMGTQWTTEQAVFLSQFKRVFTLYDTESEAQESSNNMCNDLAIFVPIERLELDSGDPGDMSQDDVKHLRKEIFGKVY